MIEYIDAMLDRNRTTGRRSVLKRVAGASALGIGALPGIGSATDLYDATNTGYATPGTDPLQPKTPDRLHKFDPHDLEEVIGVTKALERANGARVDTVKRRLDEKQLLALKDANRPSDVILRTSSGGSFDRGRTLLDRARAPGVEVYATKQKSVRERAKRQWNWNLPRSTARQLSPSTQNTRPGSHVGTLGGSTNIIINATNLWGAELFEWEAMFDWESSIYDVTNADINAYSNDEHTAWTYAGITGKRDGTPSLVSATLGVMGEYNYSITPVGANPEVEIDAYQSGNHDVNTKDSGVSDITE